MSKLLDSAIAQIGKLHDGPDVVRMAQEIAAKQPEQAAYWRDATATTPWCGIFQAWNIVVVLGMTLPGPRDGVGPMYVNWWLDYGEKIPVGQEQPGDLAIWLGDPSPHHISTVAGNGQYVGGNQSDGVTRAHYRTPDAIRRPPVAGAVTADPHPEIKLGATGTAVVELQRLLDFPSPTGIFDSQTEVAVRGFQSSHGLDVDGEVGIETWPALLGARPAEPQQPANVQTSKGSWYSQYDGKYHWHDGQDEANSAALEVPDDAQGIARPGRETLGDWYMVRAPNGKVSIEQQTDRGPGVRTGRTIDISAAAAERFGYSPKSFPTDSIFTFWPVDPPREVAGLSKQQQAVKYRDLRKDLPVSEPTEVPTIAPETPQPIHLPAITKIDFSKFVDFFEHNKDEAHKGLTRLNALFSAINPDLPIGTAPAPAAPAPTATPLHRTPAFQLGAAGAFLTGILHQVGVLDPNMAILGALVSAGTAFLGPAGGIVGTIIMNLVRAAAGSAK